MKHLLKTSLAISALALAVSTTSFAIPITDPGDPNGPPDPPLLVKVTGRLTFRGCSPAPTNVSVRIAQPPKTGYIEDSSVLPDGSIRMRYTIVVGSLNDRDFDIPLQVSVRPSVSASVCGSGSFSPASRTERPGASNVNFDYQAQTTGSYSIPVDTFLVFANDFLSRVGLHLNNEGGQDSFITIDGITSSFDIPVTNKDLPGPGTGSGRFTVRDMNLNDAVMSLAGNAFNVRLGFEEAGREIKGRHSSLGDNAMPDFQMSNINLNTSATLRVVQAQLTMNFSNARLNASIASTGACNIFGLDWCNFLFGASGDIKRKFQQTALTQLQGATIQNALRSALAAALAEFGITGPIGTATIQGNQIVITTV